ncbi:hypothetical protein BD289DRAFT_421406 [Coniella lustricola]|uniref:3-beta hydroxysteroid dehydrogenase/isomerase domain-containing protein n=1 Tax=Coniella lustricola TaxID=2025994 RepID=A0A2T3AM77_9PEZI|nr:hypothetical protein BD289DRAFT_421406 [Coniella lustricola]
MASSNPLLGTVLVTGGCGFLGYHLVGSLLADPEIGPVHVLDLDTTRNTHPDAHYTRGSVTDSPAVLLSFLERIQPRVIFHAASPSATYASSSSFYGTNVRGTENLLHQANKLSYIQALVYTSSIDIYANPPHQNISEHQPLLPDHPPFWAGVTEYDRTKTMAHRLVLAANDPVRLKTAAIVSAHIWGVRDSQSTSFYFDSFSDPSTALVQIGPGGNRVSTVEVGNCAAAHILAAKALVDPSRIKPANSKEYDPRVDGEAFNVTDGVEVDFWNHYRDVCRLIRQAESNDALKTRVVPVWVFRLVVLCIRWALLVFTLGLVEPPTSLTRTALSWCVEDHLLDDGKAQVVLGYRPREMDRQKLLVESVEWERERRRQLAEKKGQ